MEHCYRLVCIKPKYERSQLVIHSHPRSLRAFSSEQYKKRLRKKLLSLNPRLSYCCSERKAPRKTHNNKTAAAGTRCPGTARGAAAHTRRRHGTIWPRLLRSHAGHRRLPASPSPPPRARPPLAGFPGSPRTNPRAPGLRPAFLFLISPLELNRWWGRINCRAPQDGSSPGPPPPPPAPTPPSASRKSDQFIFLLIVRRAAASFFVGIFGSTFAAVGTLFFARRGAPIRKNQ